MKNDRTYSASHGLTRQACPPATWLAGLLVPAIPPHGTSEALLPQVGSWRPSGSTGWIFRSAMFRAGTFDNLVDANSRNVLPVVRLTQADTGK